MGTEGGTARFAIELTNHGPLAGRQRVLAFARPRGAAATRPNAQRQRLWAYQATELAVGESTRLDFTLHASMLAQSDAAGQRLVQPGDYELGFSDGTSELRLELTLAGASVLVEESAI